MPSSYTTLVGYDAPVLRAFFEVPGSVYSGDPLAPAEDPRAVARHVLPEQNRFLDPRTSLLMVCMRDGAPVGRLALRSGGGGSGLATFGYFESADDGEASRVLFTEAARRMARLGFSELEGPYSPSTQGLTGVRMDAFDQPPVFQVPYTPHYYPSLLESSGLVLVETGRAWRGSKGVIRTAVGTGGAGDAVRVGSYELEVVRDGGSPRAMELVQAVVEASFQNNWRFASRSPGEFLYEARDLLPAIAEEGVAVVKTGGSPVGLLIVADDLHAGISIRPRTAVVLAVALHPDHRGSRAGLLLRRHFARLAGRYDQIATNWISTRNRASEEITAHVGLTPWITLGVYRMSCAEASRPVQTR